MKILFDEITVSPKTRNINVFDGEKDVIINKKDFEKVKSTEGAIPISENCKDLNTLKIKSEINNYSVSFTEDQQNKVTKGIIEVPSMPFAELQAYNFDPNKKYKVHINQDCMNNAGDFGSPLPTFLKSRTNIVEAAIDNDVTSIGDWAFYECSKLTSITIPNSVTTIGDYVLCDCYGLTSINIPDSVTSIGYSALFGCKRLPSITIPNGVTFISQYAFASCSSLTSVNIPDSVTSIAMYAFQNCSSLLSIALPSSITSIGNDSFDGCNKLAEITYAGTQEQWNAIQASIPSGCIIHCSDGDITIQ